MELSILIAKLYGVFLVAFGLGALINAKYYTKMFIEMYENKTFIFSWGIFASTVGLLIILNHNIWESSWVVLITIIGWVALIKGLFMLVFPSMIGISKKWFKSTTFMSVIGVIGLIFGGVVSYFGFFM